MGNRECLCRSREAQSVEANEIIALSGNVSRAGAVTGAIRGHNLFKNLQAFTCKLYTSSTTTIDVNTSRHQLFCEQRGELESTQLPQCEDCLFMHTVHANYQDGIWRCSLQQHPLVPSPVKRGWVRNDDGQLTVEWMRGSPAPDAVLQLLLYKCSRRCTLPECQCMSNGLKCTNLGKLQTCDNQSQEEDLDTMITEIYLTDYETDD